MKLSKVMENLENGKKLTKDGWGAGVYIFLEKSNGKIRMFHEKKDDTIYFDFWKPFKGSYLDCETSYKIFLEDEEYNISAALDDLKKIYYYSGVQNIKCDKNQFIIEVNELESNKPKITIKELTCSNIKSNTLFPAFKSLEKAEEFIEKRGTDFLIKIAKTLKGIK